MKIRLYNFLKKPNSTKRPAGTDTYTEYDCVLKDETSIINPAVLLKVAAASEPPAWNYAYIAAFNRYYFIDDISADGPHWMVSMHCDVLATYKTTIGNTDMYILRSSYESNGRVMDTAYPGIAQHLITNQSSVVVGTTARASTPWEISVNDGCFILGVQSVDATMGSIKYIAMDPANMKLLCSTLATDAITNANGFQEIIDAIGQAMTKQLVDPLQYIKSANWIPLPYTTFASISTENVLDTGYLQFTGFDYKDITSYLWYGNILAFPIGDHPQIARGDYLNCRPYTDRYFWAPPFGMIELPGDNLLDNDYLVANYRIDMITCMGDLTLYATDDPQIGNVNLTGNLISRISAMVGVPVNMTQATRDYLGMIGGVAQAAVGIATLNPKTLIGAAAGVTGITGGISDALNSKMPRFSSTGGTGGLAGLSGTWYLYSLYTYIADEDINHIGRPLCGIRKPANIPGFIVVQEADVQITGTQNESDQIKTFLESGFYYE